MSKKINDGLTRSQRQYRTVGREKNRQHVAEWRAKHPGRNAEFLRNYYRRNAEKERQRKREYYFRVRKPADRTEKGRLDCRIRKEQRRCKMAGGRVSRLEWLSILEQFGHKCAYCDVAGLLSMDHVIPLSKGGRHEASNIVPACKPCNSSKGHLFETPLRLMGTACG